MIDINDLRKVIADCYWPTSPVAINEILDRLEAAEKELAELRSSMKFRTSLIGRTEAERDALRAEIEELHVLISAVKKRADAEFRIRVKKEEEYARLCAKIEAMEQQEPVDVGSDVFRSAFEAALKAGNWPAHKEKKNDSTD